MSKEREVSLGAGDTWLSLWFLRLPSDRNIYFWRCFARLYVGNVICQDRGITIAKKQIIIRTGGLFGKSSETRNQRSKRKESKWTGLEFFIDKFTRGKFSLLNFVIYITRKVICNRKIDEVRLNEKDTKENDYGFPYYR